MSAMVGPTLLGDRLPDLVTSPGFAPLAFVVAFAAGALHAVGPGHGKSLAAAYLVGSEGRRRDAGKLVKSNRTRVEREVGHVFGTAKERVSAIA